MQRIYLLTNNPGKLHAAQSAFTQFDIEVCSLDLGIPEIQADTSLEIARTAAIQAAKVSNKPVVREDHSLFIHALGVPGPYTNYIEKQIPAERLISLIKFFGDNAGHFEVATVLAQPSGEVFEYIFDVPVIFGDEVKGKDAKGWNGIIRLLEEKRAITEYPEEERLPIWNQGYLAVAEHITH